MKILLVEDQLKVASFIVKGLQENSYAVDHSQTGKEAVSLQALYDYDLIVLDINLPDTSGVKLCKVWREQGLEIPIIILTARVQLNDKIEGLDAGADDYLCKPFDFGELLARIRVQLRRKSGELKNVLEAADLKMDLLKREVFRGGNKIDLTAKEFALLEYLLENKGRVISRTSLIEHVWDMHFDSDTNVVDVFIRYLRKKIDDDFEEKLIQTRRGRGYIIE